MPQFLYSWGVDIETQWKVPCSHPSVCHLVLAAAPPSSDVLADHVSWLAYCSL